MSASSRYTRLAIGAIAAFLAACAGVERNPVPIEKLESARIPGIAAARFWGDEPPPDLDQIIDTIAAQRERSALIGDVTMIALSGGAEDGAYGAGLLNAWSEMGTRPEFTVVTGVSTGALSAPFAFLGSDYDDALTKVYGGFPADRVVKRRALFDILPSASIADTEPLAELIADFATEEMLAKIAREHRRGRRLLVQSANLDAQRPVIWDLGAIAASGASNAVDVFRQALLASASIPVSFPPVLFEVEVNGERFHEMHADGGVVSQATTLTSWQAEITDRVATRHDKPSSLTIYVIRNGKIAPEPEIIEHHILDIAARSVATQIKAQGAADLLAAYEVARLRGGDFLVTWIEKDFDHEYTEPFDPDYMRALYRYGYERMRTGRAWASKPPMLMTAAERASLLGRAPRSP